MTRDSSLCKDGKVVINLNIDCAPGSPRPDGYAKVVFEYLGIEYTEPISKFFGNWIWHIPVDEVKYDKELPWISDYLKRLYSRGSIRYAGWDLLYLIEYQSPL